MESSEGSGERVCSSGLVFQLDEESFKLIPAEGAEHGVEITFETDDDGYVSFALRGEKIYERLVGAMEVKVREDGVHLSLPEVSREGPNLHAFICAWGKGCS